jgi:hypothetical protein
MRQGTAVGLGSWFTRISCVKKYVVMTAMISWKFKYLLLTERYFRRVRCYLRTAMLFVDEAR